jgi:hypothetical protein
VTVFDRDRARSGYTVFQAAQVGALLIRYERPRGAALEGLTGVSEQALAEWSCVWQHARYGTRDQIDLVQVDFEGNVVWRFDRLKHIHAPGEPGVPTTISAALPVFSAPAGSSCCSKSSRDQRDAPATI